MTTDKPAQPPSRAERVLFALAPASSDGATGLTLTFLVSPDAWDYMSGGLAHTFDLTTLGLPLRIIIGRCDNHAHGIRMLERANGGPLADMRDTDFAINPGKKPTH